MRKPILLFPLLLESEVIFKIACNKATNKEGERGYEKEGEVGREGGGGSVAMNTCLIEKAWLITKKKLPLV